MNIKKLKVINYLWLVIIFVFVFSVGIYFRLYPHTYNQNLLRAHNARIIAIKHIKDNLHRIVKDKLSNLGDAERRVLEEDRLNQLLAENKANFNKIVKDIVIKGPFKNKLSVINYQLSVKILKTLNWKR